MYAAVQVMRESGRDDWQPLADGWQTWLDYTKVTASVVRAARPDVGLYSC